MIYRGTFTVVLDACVLYPAPLRDLLLRLAAENLYRPAWTKEINDEWKRNLLAKRGDLEEDNIDSTISNMNRAFRDAEVENYENLVQSVDLPDPDDRHVVAAAIRANSYLIVTENLEDFPDDELEKYDIEAQSSDVFIQNLIDLDQEACCLALKKQREALKNPPKTEKEMRDTLKNCGLQESAKILYKNC